jgi:guanosine-diphosphatase
MATRTTMIVIDAGSSGSRAHLYTFGAPQLTTIREEWSLKRWPGLSACALREGNAPSIEANISGCARKNLSHMLHDLEAGCRSKSVHCAGAPVYLRATAGLRLLPPRDRESILQGAAEAIRQSSFRLTSPPRTLPGSEEALYDWLMVNAAAGALGARRSATFAVLDMGGGSTQIAFEPASAAASDPASAAASAQGRQRLGARLGGRSLYAVSRLGLGMNEARHLP